MFYYTTYHTLDNMARTLLAILSSIWFPFGIHSVSSQYPFGLLSVYIQYPLGDPDYDFRMTHNLIHADSRSL
ncbi:hypothetical protein C8Q72DRAFT_810799 [Fomitopsis betulina]|nr:hypothetical protein C8Q72DRAFT_810799 [Fomitopsis betulina]